MDLVAAQNTKVIVTMEHVDKVGVYNQQVFEKIDLMMHQVLPLLTMQARFSERQPEDC
jgi:hypothetical protein